MGPQLGKTTRQIEKEYNITRQTIHNWINQGLLERPKKDFRNWFRWGEKEEQNLLQIIKQKTQLNNQTNTNISDVLHISNRRYLGSKQKLLGFIEEVVGKHTKNVTSVADIFGGTGVVAALFRGQGKRIIVNDILLSNYISYLTWFGNEPINYERIRTIIQKLNSINPTKDNYVSLNFGNKYFSLENARKIGEIRERIEAYDLNNREKSFLLTSLIYAMDKVANTVGHYDAYRKTMDSLQPIYLRLPNYHKNKYNQIFQEDANQLVRRIKADLIYIDTPYNSRQYGDAYHLLENIVEWKKPRVEGTAKKMINRNHLKSNYSTQKAPAVFDDLIQNLTAKYILVSFNNMAKKGNNRSNAKISNEEIISALEKRGTVQIFNTPFRAFTAGKTNIDDHQELLYLCTVDPGPKTKHYVQSPINYTGGKYKLLPQILPLFPKNIRNFYDVFAGGANVGINVKAREKIFINDLEPNIIDLYNFIQGNDLPSILTKIKTIIGRYGLSDTKTRGYAHYGANSSAGLKDVNKPHFEQLRKDYNTGLFKEDRPIAFYVLIVFAFNNQIRFNSAGLFNIPPGKRDFNQRMERKLKRFKEAVSEKNIEFTNQDFRPLLDQITNAQDFAYLDPPYLISTASYNESGGWGRQDEIDLLAKLDELNDRGIRFALSNVLAHKEVENALLRDWAKNYNIHYLDFNYNNSNYQSTANKGKTVEVLITNY